ncbi:MAG: ABC transporter substrate-binding protein [Caldilineaceae bacterium]|nr:ABC transporter substrate-binding protein [Caldilineaceae bacterium]
MNQRSVRLLSLTLILLLVLAGCAAPSAPDAAPVAEAVAPGAADSADRNEVIELTYWHTLPGAAGEAQAELVEIFNASQDRIHVSTEFQGSYGDLATAILTAFAAGEGPDVSQLGTFEILEFQKSGVLADLKPMIDGENGIDTSGWPGTMLSAGEFDDGIYWLPFNVSVPVLYYNRDAFAEAGLDGPPETWTEFYAAARALTATNADGTVSRYGIAYIPGWFSWALTSAIWSEGGEITTKDYSNITLNDPVVVDVLTQFQELVQENVAILPDSASGGHRGMFMNGQAAMILDSPGPFADIMENSVGFEPAVANYPAGAVGKVYNPGGGGIVMLGNIDAAKQDAAWEFMKFMLSDDSLAYYADRSGYAAFTEGSQEAAGALMEDESRATMQSALPYLRGDFSVNMSPAVRTAFDEAWQTIFTELSDVQETLDSADAKAEEGIKDEIFAP